MVLRSRERGRVGRRRHPLAKPPRHTTGGFVFVRTPSAAINTIHRILVRRRVKHSLTGDHVAFVPIGGPANSLARWPPIRAWEVGEFCDAQSEIGAPCR